MALVALEIKNGREPDDERLGLDAVVARYQPQAATVIDTGAARLSGFLGTDCPKTRALSARASAAMRRRSDPLHVRPMGVWQACARPPLRRPARPRGRGSRHLLLQSISYRHTM